MAIHNLKEVIQSVLAEKKRDRCLRIADRKFDKPSAYKSGAVVRCRKGDIWKGLKEEQIQEKAKETLRTWFKRSGAPGKTGGWVDCNAPIYKDGKKTGYKPCGRKEGEKRGTPYCRPKKRISSKTPKTASEMSSAEKARKIREKKRLGQPKGKPRRVKPVKRKK